MRTVVGVCRCGRELEHLHQNVSPALSAGVYRHSGHDWNLPRSNPPPSYRVPGYALTLENCNPCAPRTSPAPSSSLPTGSAMAPSPLGSPGIHTAYGRRGDPRVMLSVGTSAHGSSTARSTNSARYGASRSLVGGIICFLGVEAGKRAGGRGNQQVCRMHIARTFRFGNSGLTCGSPTCEEGIWCVYFTCITLIAATTLPSSPPHQKDRRVNPAPLPSSHQPSQRVATGLRLPHLEPQQGMAAGLQRQQQTLPGTQRGGHLPGVHGSHEHVTVCCWCNAVSYDLVHPRVRYTAPQLLRRAHTVLSTPTCACELSPGPPAAAHRPTQPDVCINC